MEIKNNAAYVFGHPFAIEGMPNENADNSAIYRPKSKTFLVTAYGYQCGKEPHGESFALELSVGEFEEFFEKNFV